MAIDRPGDPDYEPNPILRAARGSSVSTDPYPSTIFKTTQEGTYKAPGVGGDAPTDQPTVIPGSQTAAKKAMLESPTATWESTQSYQEKAGAVETMIIGTPTPLKTREEIYVESRPAREQYETEARVKEEIRAARAPPSQPQIIGRWEEQAKAQGMPTFNARTQREQLKDTFSSYGKAKAELRKAGEDGSLFTQFNVGVAESALDIGYLGYRTIKGTGDIITKPKARRELKEKLLYVPGVAAMAVPNLLKGSYSEIKEGRGMRLAGQTVGSGLVFGASVKAGKIPKIIKADVGLKNFVRSERAMVSFTPTYERQPLPAPKPARKVQVLTKTRPVVLPSIAHLQYPPPISAMPKPKIVTAAQTRVATMTKTRVGTLTTLGLSTQTLTQPRIATATKTQVLTMPKVRTQVQTQPKIATRTQTQIKTKVATGIQTLTLPKTLTQTMTQVLPKVQTKTKTQTQTLPVMKLPKPKIPKGTKPFSLKPSKKYKQSMISWIKKNRLIRLGDL